MKFKKEEKARTPIYATEGSAGADLSVYKQTEINPHEAVKVDIGLSFEIPQNHFGMVVPRSSLFNSFGLVLVNSVGIIDSDYRGNISMNLYNTTDKKVTLDYGTRIGQIVFIPYLRQNFQQSLKLSETTRGKGGYGSTGQKDLPPEQKEIQYITSPNELPQNLIDLIRGLTDSISAFHYTMMINSSDNAIFIDNVFTKFSDRIDKVLDNYIYTVGYALKEKKENGKNNP